MAFHPSGDVFATRNANIIPPQPASPKLWPIFERRQTRIPAATASGSEGEESEEDNHSDSQSEFEGFSEGSNSTFGDESDQDDVDPIEREIDRNNRIVKVDEDGIEWYIQEPVYTKKGWLRRGQYSTALLYSSSSPAELRQYVKDRGLPDPYPQGITLKYFYIVALDRADNTKSFRFLDLIPEMRNLVYKQLLIFGFCGKCPVVHGFCHPAILQTSKQVYKEAKEILYAENTINCLFAVLVNHGAVARHFTQIHTTIADGDDVRLSCVFHGMAAIPDWFRLIRSLQLTIDVHGNGSVSRARSFAEGCTLNLASFLMDKHSLKKLQVHIINHLDNVDAAKLTASILYPLRRLRGISEVQITGNVDPGLSQAVVTDMQRAPEEMFNTVPHLYKLRSEGWAYVHLAQKIQAGSNGNYFDYDQPDSSTTHSNHVRWLLEETRVYFESDDEDLGLFEDSDAETNTRHKMEDLKRSLDRVDLTKLDYYKTKLDSDRKARTHLAKKSKWIGVEDKNKKKGYGVRQWKSMLLGEK